MIDRSTSMKIFFGHIHTYVYKTCGIRESFSSDCVSEVI